MSRAYLSLGSNLGDRLAFLAEAVKRLTTGSTQVVRTSAVFETAPQGKVDQPAFLNLVAEVATDLDPVALLHSILALEQVLGRVRLERWGPRTVDIDILLYDDIAMNHPELTLPHPRMAERAFVLVPLLELDPSLHALQRQLEALPDQGVTRFVDGITFLRYVRGVQ